MKTNRVFIKATLLSVVCMLVSLSAFGRDLTIVDCPNYINSGTADVDDEPITVKINGIYYNLYGESSIAGVVASSGDEYSGSISIPAHVKYDSKTYSVTYISKGAFEDCKQLTRVTLPIGLTYIGRDAFYGCENLSYVYLPGTVERIDVGAFHNCKNITSITIPKSLTEIGYYAFKETGLKYITVESGNPVFDSREGCNAIIKTATNTMILGSANTTFPSSVKKIGFEAFYGNPNVKSIVLPEGLTEIADEAFSSCENLTSVNIPSTVTEFGSGVFHRTGLTSFVIPANWKNVPRSMFSYCTELTKVTLHDDIAWIGDRAFSDCRKLSDINLPKGLTAISNSAFYNCRSLKSVDLSEMKSLEYLGDEAFASCRSLTSVKIPSSITYHTPGLDRKDIFIGCPIEYFETDNELICSEAFFNSIHLKKVVIGNSVKNIPDDAFALCDSLESLTLSENLVSIGNNAFKGCALKGALNIPSTVETLGSNAFEDCNAVTSITLSDKIKVIGNSTFKGCKLITSLTLPSSLSEIGDSAFYNCSKLQSITIPNSVRHIGEFAFIDCVNAKTITLPSSADLSIGKRAFFNNFYTTAIYSPSPVPPAIDFVTFYPEDKSLCTVYVPVGSAAAYKGADGWKDYNIVEKNSETCEAPKITLEGGKIRFSSNTLNARYRYSVRMKEIESETSGNEGIEAKIVISAYTIAGSNTDSPVATREFSLDELIGIEGDVNGDNEVNVSDVTKLVNLILKK